MSIEVNDRPYRRGVSMIELVIAAMVMGIMAAVAAPRFAEALQYHRIEMAAKRLVADLESVRSLAYTTGTSQTIRFHDKLGKYQIVGVVDPDRPLDPNYTVDLTDTPYHCTFASVSFSDLTYNGHGLPNSGGKIVIESGGLQRAISVNATSGRASY
jgi:prepilin-type N-terminal cleavage/methylation domain-containing protein